MSGTRFPAALIAISMASCHTPSEDAARMTIAPRGGVAPAFSMMIPAGFVRRPGATPEWIPDGFVGQGIRIGLDYGPTYDVPDCTPPRCRVHLTRIGGRPARWFGVDISNPGDPFDRRTWFVVEVAEGVSLHVDVICAGRAACARAEGIVRTIRFERAVRSWSG